MKGTMENIFGNPEKDKEKKVRWKVSGAWARKPINCTLKGIMQECMGCCKERPGWVAETKYPIRAFGPGSKQCGHFVEGKGCKWTIADRPMMCMLYPFVINKSDTLVISGRALTSSCKHAYKTQEKSIFEIFEDTFVELFGRDQYDRVYQDVIVDKKDYSYLYPSERIQRIREVEEERELKSIIPTNRNEIK
jgi:Fe-S-cluster containining protein